MSFLSRLLLRIGSGGTSRRETVEMTKERCDRPSLASQFDLEGMKASMGLAGDVHGITYRELQDRRQLIQKRMQERRKKGRA